MVGKMAKQKNKQSRRKAKMVTDDTDRLIEEWRVVLVKERNMDSRPSDSDVIKEACLRALRSKGIRKKI